MPFFGRDTPRYTVADRLYSAERYLKAAEAYGNRALSFPSDNPLLLKFKHLHVRACLSSIGQGSRLRAVEGSDEKDT